MDHLFIKRPEVWVTGNGTGTSGWKINLLLLCLHGCTKKYRKYFSCLQHQNFCNCIMNIFYPVLTIRYFITTLFLYIFINVYECTTLFFRNHIQLYFYNFSFNTPTHLLALNMRYLHQQPSRGKANHRSTSYNTLVVSMT